jgi:hypothetical protein
MVCFRSTRKSNGREVKFDLPSILSRSTDRLKVVRLENVRWSDLGKPDRVMATLAEAGIQPEWAKTLAKKATA